MKKFFKNKIFRNIIFSIIAVIGIVSTLKFIYMDKTMPNSFLWIIIFYLYYHAYIKVNFTKTKGFFAACIFSLLMAITLSIGTQLEYNSNIFWNLYTPLNIICLWFAFFPFIISLFDYFTKNYVNSEKENKLINSPKLFIITFGMLLLCNFLVWLALYPGVYGYDAGFHILQIIDADTALTTRFSVLYSLILGNFVKIGYKLFNSYQVGFAIYTLIQMIIVNFVVAKIIVFASKNSQKLWLYVFLTAFFCLCPIYHIMNISSCQDVLFASVFGMLILQLLKLYFNQNLITSKIFIIKYFILTLLLCLLRNNGFYCLLFMIPFIFLINKRIRIKLLIILLAPLITYQIFNNAIIKYTNIEQGNALMEMLSVPSQQFARVYTFNNPVYNKNELNNLDEFYKLEEFQYYHIRESISDPTKGAAKTDAIKKYFGKYINLWFSICIKDPTNYVEAFLLNNLGSWYPNKNYNDDRMYHPYLEFNMLDAKKYNEKYIVIERNSKLPFYEKILEKFVVNNFWKNIPIISTLFSAGIYIWLLLFVIMILMLKKQKELVFYLMIIVGLYATILLAPVTLFRYIFPIFIISPVLISLLFHDKYN